MIETYTDLPVESRTSYRIIAENKLVQVDKYDSTPTLTSTSTYSYDGFGRRVKKSVDGAVTYYVYDMEDIRFETDELGTITAEYVHGSWIDEPLAMRRNGSNYYYHVNGLGSITALTDSSKAVVQSYVYDSFGQIISQTGTIINPYTYTAREYDEETGMYYYRARYYDAKMGRFISEDPIGINGGINLYAYVGNNPVNWIDPYGLWCIKLWSKVAGSKTDWWNSFYWKLTGQRSVAGGIIPGIGVCGYDKMQQGYIEEYITTWYLCCSKCTGCNIRKENTTKGERTERSVDYKEIKAAPLCDGARCVLICKKRPNWK